MNPLRRIINHAANLAAESLYGDADAQARAWGLEVTYANGVRTVRDPRVAVYAERRRARILRDGPDPIDQLLMDAGTRAALAATADRIRCASGQPGRIPAITRAASIEAAPAHRWAA